MTKRKISKKQNPDSLRLRRCLDLLNEAQFVISKIQLLTAIKGDHSQKIKDIENICGEYFRRVNNK